MMISRMCTVLLIAAVILTPLPAVAAGEPNPAPQQEGIPAAGEEPFSTRPADTQTAGHEPAPDTQPNNQANGDDSREPALAPVTTTVLITATVVVTEIVPIEQIVPVTQTVIVTEIVRIEQPVLVTETLMLTEVVPVEVIVPVTQTVIVTEIVRIEQPVLVTETLILTEVVPVEVIVPVTQTVIVTEVVPVETLVPVTQTSYLTETVMVTETVLVTETVVVTETVSPAQPVPALAPPAATPQPENEVTPTPPISNTMPMSPTQAAAAPLAAAPTPTSWTQLSPSYYDPTPLPVSGLAMYYAPNVMENVAQYRLRVDKIEGCDECVGSVALLRAGDLDRKVWIQPEDGAVEGPFQVLDVAARHHIPSLLARNWVVDVDYTTAMRWGMRGPVPVTIYAEPPAEPLAGVPTGGSVQ